MRILLNWLLILSCLPLMAETRMFIAKNNDTLESFDISKIDSISFCKPIPSSVTDIDGNVYSVLKIGSQLWMGENLRVLRYDTLTNKSEQFISNSQQPTYTPYKTDTNNFSAGLLYNWAASVGVDNGFEKVADFNSHIQGVCPSYWHIPTKEEWTQLISSTGSMANAALSLRKSLEWNIEQIGYKQGVNNINFSAIPSGIAHGSLIEDSLNAAAFWSSTIISESSAYSYKLTNTGAIYSGSENKDLGLSVRCLWNDNVLDNTHIYVYKKDGNVISYVIDELERIYFQDMVTTGTVTGISAECILL